MQNTIDHLASELAGLRTGRANTAMIEDIMVEVYGAKQPLKHVASITISDPKTLTVQPYDPTAVSAAEKAIREKESLGLNPRNEGKVLHIPIPELTSERREQLVKVVKEKVEQANISLRNVRHEILDEIKKLEKDGEVTKDDLKLSEDTMNDKIKEFKQTIDEMAAVKEQDILSV